jgi:enamine deaminase RidA (YjgF/YER057c/UK114 family)
MMSNVIVSGDKVYLAGILGTDESGQLVAGGAKAETAQALQNVSARLELAGLDLSDGQHNDWTSTSQYLRPQSSA